MEVPYQQTARCLEPVTQPIQPLQDKASSLNQDDITFLRNLAFVEERNEALQAKPSNSAFNLRPNSEQTLDIGSEAAASEKQPTFDIQ